ncbi:MAG: type II toxin-antitoxin system HicB family antitoxin [SAR202 cluster bacterium]|nr:type II toxin-antitoxin system HicB family antitoxin [SAR202 cluster bacterium]|tara:strand:+ start:3933 stop:4139 length:207 start_codon:yes stop_codon:yes gene_type:complete
MKHTVVFEKAPNNWSAYVPDLPGCVATGESREETEHLMREAIKLHVEALRDDNEPVPEPEAWTTTVEV